MGYIDEKEVIKENVKLTQGFNNKLPYDIYYVEFKLLDGTSKKVRVFSEKGTIPVRRIKKIPWTGNKRFLFYKIIGKKWSNGRRRS